MPTLFPGGSSADPGGLPGAQDEFTQQAIIGERAAQNPLLDPIIYFGTYVRAPGDPIIGQTSAATMNKAAKKSAAAQQATVAGLNSLLRVVYGLRPVGALLGKPVVNGNTMTFPCFWCHGEIHSFQSVQIDNNQVLDSTQNPANYTGAAGQGVDPTLLAAYGAGFSDTYPGVAYSVIQVNANKNTSGFPRVTALIKGRKVRPTQAGARVYSTNPTLCLADFAEDTIYGAKMSVNWTDVATCVSANDVMIGSGGGAEKTRTLNLVVDNSIPSGQWLEVMKDYAGLWIVPEGNVLRLVPDVAGSPVATFDASNIVKGSVRWTKRAARNQPTGIEIVYSDTTQLPWIDKSAFAYLPGVAEGTAQRRMSRIAMPGLASNNGSEPRRRAVERLNNSTLGDMSITFTAFDEAIVRQVGDLITVAHPIWGNLAKQFRVTGAAAPEAGRWNIAALEYDPAKYSSVIQTVASTPDIALPSPSSPLAPLSLSAVEESFQTIDGLFSSRIKLAWTAPIYPFIKQYRVEIFKDVLDGAFVGGGDTSSTSFTTGAVAEGQNYAIRVTLVSTTGVDSTPAVTALLVVGHTAAPSDLISLVAAVAGNVTRITFGLPSDLNLASVELRYGPTSFGTGSAAWTSAAANIINRVPFPLTTYETTAIPTGTWRIYGKARNTVKSAAFPFGIESVNEVHVDVTVSGASGGTPPPALVVGDDLTPSGVTLVNMTAYIQGGWITDMLDTWSSRFGGAAMSTFTNPLATYHTSATSSLTTTAIDLGLAKSATFQWTPTWTDLSGAASAYIETSLDNVTFTRQAAGLSYQGTARYIRGCLETLTTGTLWVKTIGRFAVLVDGVAAAIDARTSWVYGGGSDGSVHFDGTNTFAFASKVGSVYTLTRNPYATDITIDTGVTVVAANWQLFVTGLLTVNGHLSADGGNGLAAGTGGGHAANDGVSGIYAQGGNGGAGGNTGAGSVGGSTVRSCGTGPAGAGGAGVSAAGAAGGTATQPAVEQGGLGVLSLLITMLLGKVISISAVTQISGGPGGGGGGGKTAVARGGQGAAGGGVIGIFARYIAGIGSITAKGGNGFTGDDPAVAPGGGGGGGGTGGGLLVATTTALWQTILTVSVAGGIGGPSSLGVVGGNGAPGTITSVIL